MRRPSEQRTRARGSVLEPICAIRWLLVCLGGLAVGCLNPFPDDQPSNKDREAPSVVDVSPRAPDAPLDPATGSTSGATPPPPAGEQSSPEDLQGVDEPDAGTPPLDAATPPADAGADAAPSVIQ